MPAQVLAAPAGLGIADDLLLIAYEQSRVFAQSRQPRTIGCAERQPIQNDRKGGGGTSRNQVRQRSLELPADDVSHAERPEHLIIDGSVETIAANLRQRVECARRFDLRNRHAGGCMHGEMKRDPVGSTDGVGRQRLTREVGGNDLVALRPQPGGR